MQFCGTWTYRLRSSHHDGSTLTCGICRLSQLVHPKLMMTSRQGSFHASLWSGCLEKPSGNIRSRSSRVWSIAPMTPSATSQRPSVAVIGLGYIGLPTAAVLASSGAEVVGVDVNADAVTTINAGQVPFVEPDMATTVAGVVSQGYLRATTETPHAE